MGRLASLRMTVALMSILQTDRIPLLLESLRLEGAAEVSPINSGTTGVAGVSKALQVDLVAVATDRLQANLAATTRVERELMGRATKVATQLVWPKVEAVAVLAEKANPLRRAGRVELAFPIR